MLEVAIIDQAGTDRMYRPFVVEALSYWETYSEQYAEYAIEYQLVDTPDEADVIVTFVSSIEDCGREGQAAGCAPYITHGPVERPVTIQIQNDYTEASTVHLLKHEFGHTLGLDHGDAPQAVMAAETQLQTLPKPDAGDRALPWKDPELTVAVTYVDGPPENRTAVNRQIDAALAYFGRGADGTVPENVSFRRVDDPAAADITIYFSNDSPCPGITAGSCSRSAGYDPDEDGRLETYTHVDIYLTNVDTEAVAWHVANRIGADAFGFEEASDYPPPIRPDATYIERRSRWWE